jgi:hypothetical protein
MGRAPHKSGRVPGRQFRLQSSVKIACNLIGDASQSVVARIRRLPARPRSATGDRHSEMHGADAPAGHLFTQAARVRNSASLCLIADATKWSAARRTTVQRPGAHANLQEIHRCLAADEAATPFVAVSRHSHCDISTQDIGRRSNREPRALCLLHGAVMIATRGDLCRQSDGAGQQSKEHHGLSYPRQIRPFSLPA